MNVNSDFIRFEFRTIQEDQFLLYLAQLLGTTPVNGRLVIDPSLGKGSVTRKVLDKGLTMLCFDFQLNAGVIFAKMITPKSTAGRSFVINYLLSAEDVIMESPTLNRKFELKGGYNILLLPDDADLNFEVKSGVVIKVVSICIEPEWVEKEFGSIQAGFTDFLHKFLHTDKPPVVMESSTPGEFRMLSDLLKHTAEIPQGILNLKPKAMTLAADFFNRIYHKPVTDVLESRIMHYQKMQEVEEMLKDHIEKVLPDIESIARKVMLSVSTLKRHFKIVYSKGVYEYYLELKMEHAKRLLMDNNLSVNEVATKLNYEKVSSFIDMFKKHNHFSPGVYRKKAS